MSTEDSPRDDSSDEFTAYLVIGLAARDERTKAESISRLHDFLSEERLPREVPLITSVTPERIAELEAEASDGPLPPLRSLNSYVVVDISASERIPEDLVAQLTRAGWTEAVYRERRALDPQAAAGPNPYAHLQTHLGAAPKGIDARWVWRHASGQGAGVVLVDVEQAWNLDHEDLPPKRPPISGDSNPTGNPNHGTAVLGIVAAADNAVGVLGIAPSTQVRIASRFHASTNRNTHIADAIVAAASAIGAGDVILVEVQRAPKLPTEIELADFDAIRLACGVGRVVIEAAGNAKRDLDGWANDDGKYTLDRAHGDFFDSGAVMVGAVDFDDHRLVSNHGSRVDCHAHGAGVATAGYEHLTVGANPNARYGFFDGSSAASAIVAGAAALVQARFKALNGGYLPALAMRKLLANPATGTRPQLTKCNSRPCGPIGVMPDLRAICRANAVLWDSYIPPGP